MEEEDEEERREGGTIKSARAAHDKRRPIKKAALC